MAISDTLSEAVDEMRRYLIDQPRMYADYRPRLEKLIRDMETMRIELDTPPSDITR